MGFKEYRLPRKVFTGEDFQHTPFFVEDVSGQLATLSLDTQYSDATNIEYSTDNVTWSSTKPSIPANGRVYIRANATYWATSSTSSYKISSNRNFNVGGNIMSLLYGSNFTGNETSFPDPSIGYIFHYMFRLNSSVKSAENLVLTVANADNCYRKMFHSCSALTTAPALPATTLATNCYYLMFYGCTSLTTAPALPATTLVSGCYREMFSKCTALTTAPALPATTLVDRCYVRMFLDCTSLSSVTVGATSWETSYSFNWLVNVSATGTFTKPSVTTIPEGINGIPSGWTVVNV